MAVTWQGRGGALQTGRRLRAARHASEHGCAGARQRDQPVAGIFVRD